MTKRLAVARFWYEGNAFSPLPADFAAFERREWRSGDEALRAAVGTESELAAVAAFARTHPDWAVVVLRCASALPAGPIDDDVFERVLADVAAGLAGQAFDAVYLSLHGAAITRSRQAPDLELVRRVRQLLPNAPIGASFDLHGNVTPALAPLLAFASVYRTHPHVDMAATAHRVLERIEQCVAHGLATRCVARNTGLLLPSINMRTDAGPMHELERIAREATRGPVLEVGVFGGFPYADTVDTGASVIVVTDTRADANGDAANATADHVAEAIVGLAPSFSVSLPTPQQAIRIALAAPGQGLVAVTDPADNPLSGGGCDTPALFQALLDANVDVACVFASFADPRVVAAAAAAGVGATIDAALGGRFGPQFGRGVAVRSRVECLTDGTFRNVGPMEHGVERRCGRTAMLRIEGRAALRVIVTEAVVPADDPAFYALHGVDLDRVRLLCVKAKNHFRAAFEPRCAVIVDCDAPGPACLDFSRLPFRHARARTRAR